MPLTPQQLIDLPGYGAAEKTLRKEGRWNVTATDTERIEWMAANVSKMVRDDGNALWTFTIDGEGYDAEHLRFDIDDAATQEEAQ